MNVNICMHMNIMKMNMNKMNMKKINMKCINYSQLYNTGPKNKRMFYIVRDSAEFKNKLMGVMVYF
jgi:hypothetical protein